MKIKNQYVRISAFGSMIFIFIALFACCPVKFIADYDANIKEEIIQISKKVDIFFGELIGTPEEERKYDKFKSKYIEIEADLRALLVKNEIRPLNKESTKQSKITLELWLDDMENHKENDTVTDFDAKQSRNQFTRVFIAMAKGEEAKDISGNKKTDKSKQLMEVNDEL